MTSKLVAVNQLRPRIISQETVGLERAAQRISKNTTYNVEEIYSILRLYTREMIAALQCGATVKVDGLVAIAWQWSLTLPGLWTERSPQHPAGARVQRGIYRYIRHPNYLGVQLEILAAPLVHSAYLTSLVFGVANALLLSDRICREEQALDAYSQDS